MSITMTPEDMVIIIGSMALVLFVSLLGPFA
jgi:hypothetical protein